MSGNGRRRRGKKPTPSNETLDEPPVPRDGGNVMLSFRHLQVGYGVEEMPPSQCSAFLIKWAKRSSLTWDDLARHGKHGLGYEKIPTSQIRPEVPEMYCEDKVMIFRHEGNHAFAGFRAGDVFYVLWIEVNYGDLYDHG